MSDISPDKVKQEVQTAVLSDITPGASQMSDNMPTQAPPIAPRYEPPAWLQSEQSSEMSDISMSDISPSQPATQRITVRLPTADLRTIDARAEALDASRSDYLRTLVALPVTLDLSSIRHAVSGTESLSRPLGPDLDVTVEDDQAVIQAITDSMLESISNEIRSIGVNYNQAVRALNRILKKYGNHRQLSQDERAEIVGLYERLAKQHKAIHDRLKAIAVEVEALSDEPSVNLTATGHDHFAAPINKTEPERRHRVRGRKHGPSQAAEAKQTDV